LKNVCTTAEKCETTGKRVKCCLKDEPSQEITKQELIDACREIFNDDEAFDALIANASLPNIVKMAGEIAFIDEIEGDATDVVRIAAKQLRSPGWFSFHNLEEK
jgi:hypothetical protein